MTPSEATGDGQWLIEPRNGTRPARKSFVGSALFGSLCAYVLARFTRVTLDSGMPDYVASALAASSTR